jgi:hypothetical protein
VIVSVWPAIVRVPIRATPLLTSTLTVTKPSPVPAAPDATVIHASRLTAVHAHPAVACTVTVAVPPLDGIASAEGLIDDEHTGAGGTGTLAACVTAND